MSEEKAKISVVVPVYNAESTIRSCIEALRSQNYPADRYEILMVDNHSGDRSLEIIRQYPDIRCLHVEKRGSYAARNQGILKARGDVIAFTDADCAPAVSWLQLIDNAFKVSEVRVVLGRNQFAADTCFLSMLSEYEDEKAAYVFSRDDKSAYYGYTNNMAVRKDTLRYEGLFLEIQRGADGSSLLG